MLKHRVLIIIFLAGLAIRLYFALTCAAVPDFSDMATYNRLAMEGKLGVYPPPGYPLFLRFVYTLFGPYNYKAVYAAQGIISSIGILLIYYITIKASDRKAGSIAAGIAAIYPNLIIYNLTTMTESLGVFCFLLILASMTAPVRPRYQSILAAFTFVASLMIRPVLIYAWPGIFLGVKKKLIFLASFIVLISPLVTYSLMEGTGSNYAAAALYKTYNKSSDGYSNISMKDTPLGEKEVSGGTYLREALHFIINNKGQTLDIVCGKLKKVFGRGWDVFVLEPITGGNDHIKQILLYGYIPVMLLGFIGIIRYLNPENRFIALPMLSYIVFMVLLTIFKFRYRVVVEPALIIFTGILVSKKCDLSILRRLKKS